ncbi:hypothetical protein AAXE64_27865 [Priestia megaterium]|uniref:hypothetical protein n=1 Tax=Priestia megaterium TaxID=1404 RepID=UPI003D071E60
MERKTEQTDSYVYKKVRQRFNYKCIHDLLDKIQAGELHQKKELAELMWRTFDLKNPVNQNLYRLYLLVRMDIKNDELKNTSKVTV